MKKLYCFLVLGLLVCAGCVDRTPIHFTTAFDRGQAERQMRSGRNTVIANIFTRDPHNGTLKTCAGYETMLIPATERSAEYIEILFGSATGGQLTNSRLGSINRRIVSDPNFNVYVSQRCDSDGLAVFNNVGDGEFYILGGAGGCMYAGKVYVRGGETKKVVLSGTGLEYRKGFDYEHWERYERRREWEARKRK